MTADIVALQIGCMVALSCKLVRKQDELGTNGFRHAALSRSRVKHPVAKRLNRVYPETFKCDAGIQKVIAEERARASHE